MKTDQEPAFPTTSENLGPEADEGISIRDYFAGKAMQGFLSNPRYFDSEFIGSVGKDIADNAYFMADEMIEHREK